MVLLGVLLLPSCPQALAVLIPLPSQVSRDVPGAVVAVDVAALLGVEAVCVVNRSIFR